jgi:menaquinone-dependent protoporphyrinogen IX oxidase
MKKILVTYTTMAGSTAEVAVAVGEELARQGLAVEVLPMHAVKDLEAYRGVVAGAPMIMGWHRQALGFLRRHRKALQNMPLAVFVTAMSLTQTGESSLDGVALAVDAKLPKPPCRPGA